MPKPEDFPLYTYLIKSFDEVEVRIGDNTYVSGITCTSMLYIKTFSTFMYCVDNHNLYFTTDIIGIAFQQTDIIPSKTNGIQGGKFV